MRLDRRTAVSVAAFGALAKVAPTLAKENPKANKAVAQRYIDEVLNAGNMATLDEIVSPQFTPVNPDDAPGVEGLKARLSQMLQINTYTVKDVSYGVATAVAESNYVLLRGDVKGTSSAGKKIDATFFVELKFSGGLIVAEWSVFDQKAMFGF